MLSSVLAVALTTAAPATASEVDEAPMRSYLAAILARDSEYLEANTHPEVQYDSQFLDRTAPSNLEESVEAIFAKTKDCDVGALLRDRGSKSYTVNWWCSYYDEPAGIPFEGGAATFRVRDGHIEISNFSWSGPYPAWAPRRVEQ
ncbi:hypothetical protein K3148_03300 [Qipengyuania aurantiaca]|uniref:Nuclear transport factor 2 family protein n=1 Tax=Qipengyuania aurantiaca TaxID=2867233 RepID=A0ABX8ZN72_9SPHN|nr:hypothetical protein [Qipengyuania aurantiaca]QZD90432.1 hypothetical protein K3148_03300 [Qipengyuania aurantiaca]